jgi:uncharacterized protein YidB (DUF937 family)
MTYHWGTVGSGGETCNTDDQGGRRLTRLPARVLRYFHRPIPVDSGFSVRTIEQRSTVSLTDLDGEIAAEFNLGPKAGALTQQIMRLIAEQPESFAGFLEKLKECGCGAPAAPGLGRADAPLTVRQVKKLVGTPFIKEVAKYLEIPQGFASKVLGAAIPKLAALLAVQKPSPQPFPANVLVLPTFFALRHSRGRAGVQQDAGNAGHRARLRFVFPVVTLLFAGGVLGYAISNAVAGHTSSALPAAVACSLPYGIGNSEIAGDFAVGAGWTKNLTAEYDSHNGANPKLLSAGKTLTMKRALQEAGYSSKVRSAKRNGKSGHASKS